MIYMELPFIPPSINTAYFTVMSRVGKASVPKRVLTEEGKAFKAKTAGHLARNYPTELQIFRPNIPYAIAYLVSFDSIVNKTWPESAETRYKRIDASNRVKLVEDALVVAAGVDDSQFVISLVGKDQGPPKTVILAWDLSKESMNVRGHIFEDGGVLLSVQQDGTVPAM
jgi:hypothetical protein